MKTAVLKTPKPKAHRDEMGVSGWRAGTSVKNVPKQHTLSLALCGLGFWEIGEGLSKSFVVKRSMTFFSFDVFFHFWNGGGSSVIF